MKECEICGRYVELVDAVVEGKPVEICRNCAKTHNAIILTKPTEEKLKKVERIFSVRERLEEASKLREREKQRQIKEIEEKKAFPDTLAYKLRKEREKAGLSREKLSDILGITQEEIEKIEAGEIPSPKVLRRYEQFFKKEFKQEQETAEMEDEKINFRDEKITLKDLIDKAKTFFTGKRIEKPEENKEIKEDEKNKISEREKENKGEESAEKVEIKIEDRNE